MSIEPKELDTTEALPCGQKRAEDFLRLWQDILSASHRGPTRIEFLTDVSRMLLGFSGCDELELRHQSGDITYRWRMMRAPASHYFFDILPNLESAPGTPLDYLCKAVLTQRLSQFPGERSAGGSLEITDVRDVADAITENGSAGDPELLRYGALALVPIAISEDNRGVLILKRKQAGQVFDHIELFEGVAQAIGLASANRRAQEALHERVKELACLFGITQIAEDRELTLEARLQQIVNLLPAAWRYPALAVARIDVDDHTYLSPGFCDGRYLQKVDVVILGVKRGSVEVAYITGKPELVEGPFLKEEASLIFEVARQVSWMVEKHEAEGERARLEEKLRHADRLAAVGRLVAGVAHEINEPLGSMLGFAQLARKSLSNPEQVAQDLDKIITTSLRAREMVRKLLLSARQMPTQKVPLDLNAVVRDTLSAFEIRCAQENVALVRRLADSLPLVEADAVQMNQLLVNLTVNAIQAMPQGGTLTVQTTLEGNCVCIVVEDTGVGMAEEVKRQIFTPFYTTKNEQQGTGLGLSVVQGIVTSHGGEMDVKSSIGQGTRFEVRLPVAPAWACRGRETPHGQS